MSDPTVSMVQHGIRSAMCVPLMQGKDILGVIYGDRTSTSKVYTDEDIDFFAGIAQQVTIGLINCKLMRDQEQMIRLNHDIDLARRIQKNLFPTDLPNRADLRVAALNEPGARVSGDYYDVIERDDGVTVLIELLPQRVDLARWIARVAANIGALGNRRRGAVGD